MMVLPFEPLTMVFKDVQYFVNTPPVSVTVDSHTMIMSLYMKEEFNNLYPHFSCTGNEKAWFQ